MRLLFAKADSQIAKRIECSVDTSSEGANLGAYVGAFDRDNVCNWVIALLL